MLMLFLSFWCISSKPALLDVVSIALMSCIEYTWLRYVWKLTNVLWQPCKPHVIWNPASLAWFNRKWLKKNDTEVKDVKHRGQLIIPSKCYTTNHSSSEYCLAYIAVHKINSMCVGFHLCSWHCGVVSTFVVIDTIKVAVKPLLDA